MSLCEPRLSNRKNIPSRLKPAYVNFNLDVNNVAFHLLRSTGSKNLNAGLIQYRDLRNPVFAPSGQVHNQVPDPSVNHNRLLPFDATTLTAKYRHRAKIHYFRIGRCPGVRAQPKPSRHGKKQNRSNRDRRHRSAPPPGGLRL
jgi:hypothetical protein